MAYSMLKIGVGNVLTLLVRLSGIIFLSKTTQKVMGGFSSKFGGIGRPIDYMDHRRIDSILEGYVG